MLKKLRKLRPQGCNHKRNINMIYNNKLHYKCLQQLSTVSLKTEGIRVKRNEKLKKHPSTQSSH